MRRFGADAPRLGILGTVGFLTAFGAHVLVVGLPAYSRRYGLSYGAIGLLLAAYNLAEIFVKPLAGIMADRVGPRLVMAWGTVLFTLSCYAYLLLPPGALAGLRICQGIGAGALSVSSLVLVATSYPDRLGGALGTYNALKGAGYVLAPLAGGLLGARNGLHGAFLCSGLAGTAVFALQLAAGANLAAKPRHRQRSGSVGARLWPWYLANFADMSLLGMLLGFLPVRADSLGCGPRAAGFLLSGATLAYLAAQPLAGRAADRLGRRPLVLAGLSTASLGICFVGRLQGLGLLIAAVLTGLGLGTTWTNSLAVVGEGADSRRLGGDLGLAGSCKDAGDIVGPLLLGYLAGRLGLGAGFAICGGAGLLSVAIVAAASKGQG